MDRRHLTKRSRFRRFRVSPGWYRGETRKFVSKDNCCSICPVHGAWVPNRLATEPFITDNTGIWCPICMTVFDFGGLLLDEYPGTEVRRRTIAVMKVGSGKVFVRRRRPGAGIDHAGRDTKELLNHTTTAAARGPYLLKLRWQAPIFDCVVSSGNNSHWSGTWCRRTSSYSRALLPCQVATKAGPGTPVQSIKCATNIGVQGTVMGQSHGGLGGLPLVRSSRSFINPPAANECQS